MENQTAAETGPASASDVTSPELNSLRLRFGDTMQLQVVGEDPRFSVRLVGYLENRSIIITTPIYNRRLVAVRVGQPVTVRMMVNDRACAFITEVMHTYRVPYPHVHLGYPKELVTNQLRKAVRVETRVDGSVINRSIGDRGKEIDSHLLDISETGAHLVTPIRIGKSGDEITLSLKLDIGGIHRRLSIPAILRGRMKVKEADESRKVHYGVEFLTLSDGDRIELIAFVYSKLSTTL
ncbi:MAG: c-di-GMP-binding flagellar brake protein YcgR [Candidatus Azotimanducaceae bacterium]|jgi:c-di-GMP-binding flagellar brake protein YcgR